MCQLCDNFNFWRVGFDFEARCASGIYPHAYFPVTAGEIPEDERFQFCPMCGKRLTGEHFKNPVERKQTAPSIPEAEIRITLQWMREQMYGPVTTEWTNGNEHDRMSEAASFLGGLLDRYDGGEPG